MPRIRPAGGGARSPARRPAPKRWLLYLIECRDGSIYTGITVDVAARYAAHAGGTGARYAAHAGGTGARYTRSHPPRRLLATIDYPDRAAASAAEYAVKQMSPTEKRAYADLLALSAAGARAD